jgi:branched-chain amino acid transport system substrate-binding protein
MKLHALGTGLLAAGAMALATFAGGGQARADDGPIIIGAAIALSGPIAPYDEGPYKAMEVAVDEINAKGGVLGRQLKIVYSDTKSDISYGATAAQEVIDQGATLVVVTCDYDYGSAAANVANSKNLIAFSTCAGDPKFGPAGIGPNAFTMATGSPGQAALMAEFAFKQGWKKAFILQDTSTAFEASFADTFQKRWTELAGADNFLGKDTFGGEDPQIATQITRIKSLPAQPDFIVLCSFPPAGSSAMRQLRAAGLNQPLLGSEDWDGDYWIEAVPGLTGLYFDTYASVFGTDTRPDMQAFLKKFVAKHGKPPITSHAVTGYSVIEAWTRAVTRANSLDADKVRAELEKFKDEPLLAGPTTYTAESHINYQRDMIVMEVKDGKTGTVMGVFRAEEVPQ